MMEIREVGIADVLQARDARVDRQHRMLEQHRAPLISFTMNIAGPIKYCDWIEQAFNEGVKRIEAVLSGRRCRVLETVSSIAFTGCECIWSVDADAHSLKIWMRQIEDQDELGRLFDIDVISSDGTKLSRNDERRCLICGGPVRVCARSRAHSAEDLFRHTKKIISDHFNAQFIRRIGMIAERSLLYEVATTPKPGLVDFENNGAHRDMDRFTFIDSACILRSYFEQSALIGVECGDSAPGEIFERLRCAGQQAEAAMFETTGNVNTHKGALFSLGLLCCAAGKGRGKAVSREELVQRAAELAQASLSDFERLPAESALTGGEKQFVQSGLTGVRGEAANGFPSVIQIALPALEKALCEGYDKNDAGLAALIALMANVPDSNILRRAGESGLETVRKAALSIAHPSHDRLREMNDLFVRSNLSPGGCADLLAVAWFLHDITL